MRRAFSGHPRHSKRHIQRHASRHAPRHAYRNNNNKKIYSGGARASMRPTHPRAHAHTHARRRLAALGLRPRYARPTASNSKYSISEKISASATHHPGRCRKVHERAKKFGKVLADSKNITNFARMKEPRYIITGISRLTGDRERISREMSKSEAIDRLEREKLNRRKQHHPSFTRLRMEVVPPVQTTIKFEDYE